MRLANDTIYGLSGSIWTATAPARCASRARSTPACCRSTPTPRCAWRRPVRRLQAVGLRPRARPARARRLHRGQDDLLRDATASHERAPRGQGLRDHRRGRRDRRGDRRAVRARGARGGRGGPARARRRRAGAAGRRDRRAEPVAALYADARGVRAGSTCCSTTPGSPPPTTPRCSTPTLEAWERVQAATCAACSCAASTGSRTCSRAAAAR